MAPYGVFDTADGAVIVSSAKLVEIIDGEFALRSVADWRTDLHQAGVPAGELKSLDRVYSGAQLDAQNLVWEVEHAQLGRIRLPGNPLRFSRTAIAPGLPPPTSGQHTGGASGAARVCAL